MRDSRDRQDTQTALPRSFSASVVSCSMLRPRFVVEENCQLSTSATWSQVPMGGLVKKFTFCTRENTALSRTWDRSRAGLSPSSSPRPHFPLLPAYSLPAGTLWSQSPTLGLLVSMLYHRMDAQALGIWQMLEMTTTGSEWVCKDRMSPRAGTSPRAPLHPGPRQREAVTHSSPPGRSSAPGDTPLSQR